MKKRLYVGVLPGMAGREVFRFAYAGEPTESATPRYVAVVGRFGPWPRRDSAPRPL